MTHPKLSTSALALGLALGQAGLAAADTAKADVLTTYADARWRREGHHAG